MRLEAQLILDIPPFFRVFFDVKGRKQDTYVAMTP
jgi:hypothetical protein